MIPFPSFVHARVTAPGKMAATMAALLPPPPALRWWWWHAVVVLRALLFLPSLGPVTSGLPPGHVRTRSFEDCHGSLPSTVARLDNRRLGVWGEVPRGSLATGNACVGSNPMPSFHLQRRPRGLPSPLHRRRWIRLCRRADRCCPLSTTTEVGKPNSAAGRSGRNKTKVHPASSPLLLLVLLRQWDPIPLRLSSSPVFRWSVKKSHRNIG